MVVFSFFLTALDKVDIVPRCSCEFHFDFVLKVMLQVGSKWERDSRFPATGKSLKGW